MNQPILTDKAPAAIGPYSQAIVSGNLVYTSGQLGFDPTSGKLAEGVEAQARAAFTNLREVLAAAGAQMTDVVKTTVFLKNMYDFRAMNAIYAEFFSEPYPARSAIEVAGLPKNGLVEIEAVAIKK